jgi:sugar diacid utilization regulator
VGELRLRARSGAALSASLGRALGALTALELERAAQPDRASEEAVARFLRDLFQRRVTDRENIVARGKELGADLTDGAGVLVARAHPLAPTDGDWRARLAATAGRGARRAARSALVGWVELNEARELAVLVPSADAELMRRVLGAVAAELSGGLSGFQTAVASSRTVADPVDLHRAAAEAVLTANVAEARGAETLTFEETGSYRLLLTAISEDPSELQRFFDETVAPLISYDEQYETELVRTLDTFLDEDANVARTAERLFTHRHTIRYRLERVRELTGLDVASTDGRERLGLGLKAMRVLGMSSPGGPALEAGAEGGRVPRDEKDR